MNRCERYLCKCGILNNTECQVLQIRSAKTRDTKQIAKELHLSIIEIEKSLRFIYLVSGLFDQIGWHSNNLKLEDC
jgi:hypothetical protein